MPLRAVLSRSGALQPLQSATLSDVCLRALGANTMQVALAWLLQRFKTEYFADPGTSSVAHVKRENMAAEKLHLSEEVLSTLDGISRE